MKKIWIVVHVYRGFIQEPEMFFDEKSGERRLREIQNEMNEVNLFEKSLEPI